MGRWNSHRVIHVAGKEGHLPTSIQMLLSFPSLPERTGTVRGGGREGGGWLQKIPSDGRRPLHPEGKGRDPLLRLSHPIPPPRVPSHPGRERRGWGESKRHPGEVYSFPCVPTPRVGWWGPVPHPPQAQAQAHLHPPRVPIAERKVPTNHVARSVVPPGQSHRRNPPNRSMRSTHTSTTPPKTERREDQGRDQGGMYTRSFIIRVVAVFRCIHTSVARGLLHVGFQRRNEERCTRTISSIHPHRVRQRPSTRSKRRWETRRNHVRTLPTLVSDVTSGSSTPT